MRPSAKDDQGKIVWLGANNFLVNEMICVTF